MRPAKITYFIIAFFVACLIVFKSIEYLTPDFSNGFLFDKKLIFNQWYKYFLYGHIVTAPLTVFSGLLQFSLSRKAKLHRISGYVYVSSVLLAGACGLIMSLHSIGGIASGISFLLLSCLWIYFTIKAFSSIKLGNIQSHKEFMTRSFILTNSAVLLRLFSFFSNTCLDVNPLSAYIVISWLSWLPWLLMYECVLHLKHRDVS